MSQVNRPSRHLTDCPIQHVDAYYVPRLKILSHMRLVQIDCHHSRLDFHLAILTATALYPQYNRNSECWTTLHNRDKKEEMVDTTPVMLHHWVDGSSPAHRRIATPGK